MRPGDERADRNWSYRDRRVVGPYIRDAGVWRRMVFEEAFTVGLARRYAAMEEWERERSRLWESFVVEHAAAAMAPRLSRLSEGVTRRWYTRGEMVQRPDEPRSLDLYWWESGD